MSDRAIDPLSIAAAPPTLTPFVRQIWQARPTDHWQQNAYPDATFGLHIDLTRGTAHLEAPQLTPRPIALEPGQHALGVRLAFGAVGRLLDVSPADCPARVSLTDVASTFAPLLERMQTHPERALASLVDWLAERAHDATAPDAAVRLAARRLASGQRTEAMARIAQAAGCSVRHLQRRFADEIGLTPAQMAAIHRASAARAAIARDPARPLVEVALALGFADQAQFTKHFRRYNGVTPGRYRQRKRTTGVS